jgi:hypothetical protein
MNLVSLRKEIQVNRAPVAKPQRQTRPTCQVETTCIPLISAENQEFLQNRRDGLPIMVFHLKSSEEKP